eukprot:2907343-Amphidinium_carterae.1
MLKRALATPDIEIEYVSSMLTYEKDCVEECEHANQDVTGPSAELAVEENAPARSEASKLEDSPKAHPDPEQVILEHTQAPIDPERVILEHSLPLQPTRTNVVTEDQTP